MTTIDSFADEFARLAITQGLTRGTQAYQNRRRAFFTDSAATGFAEQFGRNEADLKAWQDLCRTVGITEKDLPKSIKKCKKVSVLGVDNLAFVSITTMARLIVCGYCCRPSRESL